MSAADRTGSSTISVEWFRTWPRRYAFAFVATCAAMVAQRTLELATGFPHSFLLFYPTILIVSLVAGFRPGAVATLLGLAAHYFQTNAAGPLIGNGTERIPVARSFGQD